MLFVKKLRELEAANNAKINGLKRLSKLKQCNGLTTDHLWNLKTQLITIPNHLLLFLMLTTQRNVHYTYLYINIITYVIYLLFTVVEGSQSKVRIELPNQPETSHFDIAPTMKNSTGRISVFFSFSIERECWSNCVDARTSHSWIYSTYWLWCWKNIEIRVR